MCANAMCIGLKITINLKIRDNRIRYTAYCIRKLYRIGISDIGIRVKNPIVGILYTSGIEND